MELSSWIIQRPPCWHGQTTSHCSPYWFGGHLHVNVVILDASHIAFDDEHVSERHWQANEPFSGKEIQLPRGQISDKRHGSTIFKSEINQKINIQKDNRLSDKYCNAI